MFVMFLKINDTDVGKQQLVLRFMRLFSVKTYNIMLQWVWNVNVAFEYIRNTNNNEII